MNFEYYRFKLQLIFYPIDYLEVLTFFHYIWIFSKLKVVDHEFRTDMALNMLNFK